MLTVVASTETSWSAGLFSPTSWAQAAGRIALATHAPLYSTPVRARYDGQRLRERVAVFDLQRRLEAVCDEARHPVLDLAFHAHRPLLALATGAYDGGYAYEGELIVWNISTGEFLRPLPLNREVRRVRWEQDRLVALLAPETDEHEETEGVTLEVTDRVSARSPALSAATEASLGFSARPACPWTWPPPPFVGEVAFVDERIAAVASGALVSLFSAELRAVARVAGPSGQQLLACGRMLVAAHGPDHASSLYTLEGALVRGFDRPYLFSTDGTHLLARDASHDLPRVDLVLDRDGNVLHASDLGHYDVFNHALRLDGERLWFLRGTPPSQHQDKVLAAVSADGEITVQQAWDTRGAHLMEGTACWLGETLVRGYKVYDPRGQGERCIERGGAGGWRVRWPCAPIALAAVPERDAILAASLDGRLALLRGQDGAILAETTLRLGGLLVVPTCVAVRGRSAVVGTLDGRVLRLDL